MVLLPNSNSEKAWQLAEQTRIGVIEKAIPHLYSAISGHTTISLGVNTIIPSDKSSIDEFIIDTDKALFKAKEKRNCSVVSA